jgi:hypothetical protein
MTTTIEGGAPFKMDCVSGKRRRAARPSEAELPDEVRDRVAGLLDEEALEAAVQGLRPDELTGPGGLLNQLAGRVIEAALQAELAEHLRYPLGETPPAGNRRNGGTPKTLKTDLGPVEMRTPRDRPFFTNSRKPRPPFGLLKNPVGVSIELMPGTAGRWSSGSPRARLLAVGEVLRVLPDREPRPSDRVRGPCSLSARFVPNLATDGVECVGRQLHHVERIDASDRVRASLGDPPADPGRLVSHDTNSIPSQRFSPSASKNANTVLRSRPATDPHQPAGVMIDHDPEVLLSLPLADLIDPDPLEPIEQIGCGAPHQRPAQGFRGPTATRHASTRRPRSWSSCTPSTRPDPQTHA